MAGNCRQTWQREIALLWHAIGTLMIDNLSRPVALSLDQLKAFSSTLTPDSLMRPATLQVIAEHEHQVSIIKQKHDVRLQEWD